jgi:hypothetical protein
MKGETMNADHPSLTEVLQHTAEMINREIAKRDVVGQALLPEEQRGIEALRQLLLSLPQVRNPSAEANPPDMTSETIPFERADTSPPTLNSRRNYG